MKKFFSYLGWALLLAVIIAVFTSTGKEQCKQYVTDKLAPENLIALNVSEAPFKLFGAKLFGIYTVSYVKLSHLTLEQASSNSPAVAAIKANSGLQSATYIGLFNTFWEW
jgi:hypothetical protein